MSDSTTTRDPDERSAGPTVVGIGTSAGGLTALKTFFASVPADSGLAYVVVVHLSPERESHLPDLLQPHAKIPVQQVVETVPLEPDRIYVIPPNANIEAIDTHLRLSRLEEKRRERAPIDHFFRTLARTHDGHAVGVVLTGTGSDGALGIREIKQKQGFAIAQDPGEAEYDGMPQSAIATGMVDLVLPLAEIPEAIIRLARTEPRIPLPASEREIDGTSNQILQKVFVQIRGRTGRDFTRYKRSTILRRIARRMQLNQIEDLSNYLEVLRKKPHEAHDLADDLLVTVTSFFRDPEVFHYLESSVVPRLFHERGSGDEIRVWSVGCATGEEAYSIAMLLQEEASRTESACRIQIFASDLHEHSLARAREGFYPGEIDADVNSQRLQRFFHKEPGGYRVRKEVRELVVFAPHNLLGDPPFSRIDLILCRNVLIYLQRDVQHDVIDLFHYALRREGYLVLGTSETVENTELFAVEDKRLGIYKKRNVPAREPKLPVFPLLQHKAADERGASPDRSTEPVSFGVHHMRMVERFAPPSMLLSWDDRILHLSEHAGRYLLHPGGEITSGAPKLVREELRIELRALLHEAREKRRPCRSGPIMVRFNGDSKPVVLDVRPSREPDREDHVLVVFDEREDVTADSDPQGHTANVQLMAELDRTKQRLQTIIEEYETTQEEMRASNEELQSANEELRSTMEELETSKEELQSVNEELQTVNQENRHKVEELAQLSADLQNLLFATDIATLFLDRELRILRFTPKVSELFSIRGTDRGRPLADLSNRFGDDTLFGDAQRVLDQLIPTEREITDNAGRAYLTRILPYRTSDDQIAGVVVTMVDITQQKRTERALRESEERTAAELSAMAKLHGLVTRLLISSDLSSALNAVLDGAIEITGADMGFILLRKPDGRGLDLAASRGFSKEFVESFRSVEEDHPLVSTMAARTWQRVIVEDIKKDERFAGSLPAASGGGYRGVQSTPLLSRDGQLLGVLSTHYRQPHTPSERDLRMLDLYARQAADFIEHVQSKESLRAQKAALEEEDARKERFLAVLGHELRNPLAAVDSALRSIDLGLRPEPEIRPFMMSHMQLLIHLVDDLLDLSRMARGKVTLHKTTWDLVALVRQAAEATRPHFMAKEQDLQLSLPDELVIHGDQTRIMQVIVNLLGNASTYTPPGGHVEITVEEKDERALISVQDDGQGLSQEQLPSVFEAFKQGISSSGGLGIGLALVRDLVELHGGTVEARSDGPNRGSLFTVSLPLGDFATAPEVERSAPYDGKFPRSIRLLVIDDLEDAADSLAMVLRFKGAETATAYTGSAGLRTVESWKPEVVLVDISLPDMTGFEVAKQIRGAARNGDSLLIAVTGFGDSITQQRIEEAGFDYRFVKPVDLARLHEVITQHLELSEGRPS